MPIKSKPDLTTELNTNISDGLNRQNTAAKVRQVIQDIIDTMATESSITSIGEYWNSGSTGTNSIKAINDTTTDATGDVALAEGAYTLASGDYSHAEGWSTIAEGTASHSENFSTQALGSYTHAGGNNSIASANTSFIHSTNSIVTGDRSAVIGGINISGTSDDTCYVPYLNIQLKRTGNTLEDFLVRDSGTGDIKTRSLNSINALFYPLTGGTLNGSLSANSVSATTYYGDGSNLTGIASGGGASPYLTGGTYSAGTATFNNNSGGTFSVTGFSQGLYTYERTITKAELLDLHNTTVNISPANLGISSTQCAKIHPLMTEWWVYPDGTTFSHTASAEIALRGDTGAYQVTKLPTNEFTWAATNMIFVSNIPSSVDRVVKMVGNMGYYLQMVNGTLTGGGTNAYIKLKIYYDKIDTTF